MRKIVAALRDERGFTLLEIVISLVLLTIVFGFFDLMAQSVLFTNRGRFDDIGRSIVIEQLELYRAMEFNLLPNEDTAVVDDDLNLLPSGTGIVTFTDYGGADSGIIEIDATVSWTDKGVTRDVSITTLVTEGGVGK